ncbi:MAG: hypothetical protein AAAFM81_02010 [Pseudomonadota bacterium]
MSRRRSWQFVHFAAIGVVIMTVVIAGKFPTTGGDFAPGYAVPVYAFEFAQTADDVARVFGPIGDPLRSQRIAEMDDGNYWDFPFMTAYSLFLGLFFLAASRESGNRFWRLPAGIGFASGVFDGIENWILLGLTADFDALPYLEWLRLPVTLKFSALVACAFFAGLWFLKQSGLAWRCVGGVAIALSVVSALGLIIPHRYAFLIAIGIGPVWLAQWLFAVVARRRSLD